MISPKSRTAVRASRRPGYFGLTEPRREAAVELLFFFKGFAAVVDAVRAANGAFFFADGLSASSRPRRRSTRRRCNGQRC